MDVKKIIAEFKSGKSMYALADYHSVPNGRLLYLHEIEQIIRAYMVGFDAGREFADWSDAPQASRPVGQHEEEGE